MPKRKNYDRGAVARLFADQGGFAGRCQLIGLGVPPSTIRHRERPGGPWRRVLRGVCACHDGAMAGLGPLRAAMLYAGPGTVVTGFAALRAHGVAAAAPTSSSATVPLSSSSVAVAARVVNGSVLASPSPSPSTASSASTALSTSTAAGAVLERAFLRAASPTAPTATAPPAIAACPAVATDPAAATDPAVTFDSPHAPDLPLTSMVKVLIPSTRRRNSAAFVLVSRTRRMPAPVEIEGCRLAPVARAAVDACLDTKDTELIRRIVIELVHSGLCSPAELRTELEANQTRRSARMRAVLVEFADGVRTGAEAQCRRRLARVAAPPPLWNRRILERSTGRVALLPGAVWPERGVALDLDSSPAGHPPAAARRRWMSSVLRLTVAQVTPSEVRDRWDEVWAELRALLNRPTTYELPVGYAFA
jgi:hypothetical protein